MGRRNGNSIFMEDIKEWEICSLISDLDEHKSIGYDEIPTKVIKWANFIYVTPYLTVIFKKCLNYKYILTAIP